MNRETTLTIGEGFRAGEFRDALLLTTGVMIVPLYLSFWLCDVFYAPHLRWEFLALRLTSVMGVLLLNWVARRVSSYLHCAIVGCVLVGIVALPISWMTVMTSGPASAYYAGLNLVAVGAICFFPWRISHLSFPIAATFIPYYVLNLSFFFGQAIELMVPSFFIIGTIIIAAVLRVFLEKMRRSEAQARWALQETIASRDEVIAEKSREASTFSTLSRQFSPQVVRSLINGCLDVHAQVRRRKICAIFVDIEGSTERISRLDKDDVDTIISMFMDDAIKTFLKYDVTVDNFLGDCVLGFCNSPLEYEDFVERVLRTSTEIQSRVQMRQREYLNYWMGPFLLKIGVAVGYANVGFYGREECFRRYTAIGSVMNKAARLCSHARGGEILVSGEAIRVISDPAFSFSDKGFVRLKGFESDLIHVYALNRLHAETCDSGFDQECPQGHGVLHVDVDKQGIFIFTCRVCGYILNEVSADLESNSETEILGEKIFPQAVASGF